MNDEDTVFWRRAPGSKLLGTRYVDLNLQGLSNTKNARRSCLAAPTLLGNNATVNMGRSLAFLFSFSLTSLSLLLPWEEQVQCCHHVSYTI